MTSSRTDDEGAVTVLVLAAMTAMLAMVPVVGAAVSAIAVKHRLDGAADLAALAAALDVGSTGACATAERLALANGSRVVACTLGDAEVTVTVEPLRPPAGVPFRLSSTARAGIE